MDFQRYYLNDFRTDLRRVISGLEPIAPSCVEAGAIQPRTLSRQNPAIRTMDAGRRDLFASALYLTVLVDQVMHYYFPAFYESFRVKTVYPKLKGDCPGACQHNIDPGSIFNALNKTSSEMRFGRVDRYPEVLPRALTVFKSEVLSFFSEYLPEVSGKDVWAKCMTEARSRLGNDGARNLELDLPD